ANNHRLATAKASFRHRGFVGHALSQAVGVQEGFVQRGVGPHAHTAQGRAVRRIVNRDNGVEATMGIVTSDDGLVTFYWYFAKLQIVPSWWPRAAERQAKLSLQRVRYRRWGHRCLQHVGEMYVDVTLSRPGREG